jgi:hypothetical protein
MKRRLVWLLAIGGLIWLWLRRGARRPEPVTDVQAAPAPAPGGGDAAADPAEELRRKLDETKGRDGGDETGPASEADAPPAPASVEELDAKRRDVHDRARAAADEMRRSSTD